jgi:glutaredoxin 2
MSADLVNEVAHDEQLDIWAEELTFAILEWLKEPESYDDKIMLANVLKHEIKFIVESAFSLAASTKVSA